MPRRPGIAALVVLLGLVPVACLGLPWSPATPDRAEVIIGASQFGQTVEVNAGDTVIVRPPSSASDWQVDYATEVLEMLTPADRVKSPGPDGWRLKAAAKGVTDFAVSPIVNANTGGPAGPPRFVVTVRVR